MTGTSAAAGRADDDAKAARALRRRVLFKRIGAGASLLLVGVALVVLWRVFGEMDPAEVQAAFFRAGGAREVGLAAFFAALSYLFLTGYDVVAMRGLGVKVPYRTTALGSFTSFAISFNLGFPLVTAGTVRYWIYTAKGVKASNIARLTVIGGVTFWLGLSTVLGAGLLLNGDALSRVDGLSPFLNRLVGAAVLATIAGYVVWISLRRPSVTIQGWRLTLPGPRVTLSQMLLGVGDVCAGAAVLYVLLPGDVGFGFPTFAAIYAVACMIGVLSHAPGGIGVFEATILLALPWLPRESVLGSLLLFRLLYYVAPFIVALVLLGLHELARRKGRRRVKVEDSAGPMSPLAESFQQRAERERSVAGE